MLTPGEYVFNPRAVAMYGGGLLSAMNNMQIPRTFLSNMWDEGAHAFRYDQDVPLIVSISSPAIRYSTLS